MEFNLLHLVNTEIKSNVFSKKIVFFQPEEEEKKTIVHQVATSRRISFPLLR
jgi:hypothetical protein